MSRRQQVMWQRVGVIAGYVAAPVGAHAYLEAPLNVECATWRLPPPLPPLLPPRSSVTPIFDETRAS